jgi:REP element-mobilizing transposase RayT
VSEPRKVSAFERRRRRLPHWEEPGATYFVRFSLLRPPVVDLTRGDLGAEVVSALKAYDGARYWLYDYVVMPDHVHAILQPIVAEGKTEPLWRIMQNLKSWLARRINALVGRSGPVWLEETYDHIVRDQDDYEGVAAYIFHNPTTAGLIEDPAAWPWWGKGSGAEG